MALALSPATSTGTTSIRRDVALLIGRLGLGLIFVAHGWQKLVTFGVDGVTANFTGMGVPAPAVAAWFATLVELVGGVALIVGVAVPLFAVLLVLDMLGALVLVHADKGIFVANGGYELVLALAAGAAVLAGLGSGRFGVDALLTARHRQA
jgi:putative oxidoreductase